RDELKLKDFTPRFMRASQRLKEDLEQRLAAFRHPSLLLLAGRDRIIDNERTRALYAHIGSPRPQVTTMACNHGIMFEALPALEGPLAALILGREVAGLSGARALIESAAARAAREREPAAFCGVELALLDAAGRSEGRPVTDVLGGARRAELSYPAAVAGFMPAS